MLTMRLTVFLLAAAYPALHHISGDLMPPIAAATFSASVKKRRPDCPRTGVR